MSKHKTQVGSNRRLGNMPLGYELIDEDTDKRHGIFTSLSNAFDAAKHLHHFTIWQGELLEGDIYAPRPVAHYAPIYAVPLHVESEPLSLRVFL
jgi:hypothetical protein